MDGFDDSGDDADDGELTITPATKPARNFMAMSTGPTAQRRYATTVKAKADFLAYYASGMKIDEAIAKVGRKRPTYERWRESDLDFRGKADAVRVERQVAKHRAADPDAPPSRYDGTFATFRAIYFPHEFPSPPFHADIINRLEHAPPMSVSMVLVPPNFGKSTLMEDWISYKLAVDPNHRITVVSKGQKQAQKMLGLVQRRMTDTNVYGTYINSFGPFHDESAGRNVHPWTANYFTTDLVTHDERDPSLQCLGWTSQVYGSRIDTLILDDIQTTDNLTSVDDMLDKLRLEFMTRGDRHARIFIVGTRIAMGDIYEKLIEDGTITPGCLVQYPAINHDGESLWPERWPAEVLDNKGDKEKAPGQRQRVGEKMWWTAFQQVPARAGDATFTETMISDALDNLRKVGAAPAGIPVVLGVDPGMDPGATAITALSYTSEHINVLDCFKTSTFARQEDIIALIEQFALLYHPTDVVIEQVAYQRALVRDERLEALGKKYGFRIIGHNTNKNKLDPMFGVAAMATSFLKAEVSIPNQDAYSQARMEPFIAELKAWRPNVPTRLITQDLCMSFWFAWLHILDARHSMQGESDMWKRASMPSLLPPRPRHLRSA